MKCWGFSQIYGMLAPPYQWELQRFRTGVLMSDVAFHACASVAMQMPATDAPNLALVHTDGNRFSRVFIRPPTDFEWQNLERGAIVQDDCVTCAIMDALH